MKYCPKCGTANRDGSRFCNECGEELGTQDQVECPRCGTPNSVQNVLCSQCGARLPPAVSAPADTAATPTIKGLSLPTKNPAGEQNEQTNADAEPEPDDEIPAWLRELGASLSEEGESDGPDAAEDAEEVPEWLRDLRASLPEEPEHAGEAAEEQERLPDWLAAPAPVTREAEAEPAPHDREPEPVSGPEFELEPREAEAVADEAAYAQEPFGHEPAGEEVPGWLSRLVPTAAAASSETESPRTDQEETPGWLSRLVPGEGQAKGEDEMAPESSEGEAAGRQDEVMPEEEGPLPLGVRDGEIPPAPAGIEDDELPDWLASLQPAGEEGEAGTGPAELESGEGEVPDWLAGFQEAGEEAEAVPETESEEDEVPDWLAGLRETGEEAEAGAVPETEIEEDEIPDWLADLGEAGEEAEDRAEPAEIESEEDEVPDWLADLGEAGEEAEAAPEIEESEIPDWMAGLGETGEEAEAEAVPEIEIEEGEIPDWVADLRPREEEGEEKPSLYALEFEEEELTDRIVELEPPVEEIPLAEALEEEPAHKLPDDVEAILGPAVPAWLAELQIEAPEAAAAIIEETMVDGELPDWLVRSELEPDEGLAPAEIPAWLLALKPTELREEGEEDGIVPPPLRDTGEKTGLLAGIPGVLPVEMLIAQPRAIVAAEWPELALEDSPPAQLFADIVGRPPDAAPKEIAMRRADVLPRTARWILYAILIAVVAVPIIVGKPLLLRTIETTAATVDMHTAIEALDSLDPVLVAFDYDPTSSGEMDLIARALIGDLMDQEARVVVVSLLPAGPASAQTLLAELAADRPGYADSYGERYANLGYLPGQAAAVRLLGLSLQTAAPQDFYGMPLSDLPAMQGLDSTQSFSLIVELAATQDTLRWWIEQAGTPYDIPMGAGASAAIIPYARPYYETEPRQLIGLVGGVPDGVTYEALASDQGSPTNSSAARLDSQLAGQVLFVLVLLAGNVVYFSRRGTRRER